MEPVSKLQEIVDKYFSHHAFSGEQLQSSDKVRHTAKQFAYAVLENCPQGRSRDEAIRCAREALMFANSSIAVGGDE